MSENDEFVQSKRNQYHYFTRILFWMTLTVALSLAALAVVFF